ncbi:MAG: hypothetical protein ACRDZ9_08225 [Acidimicrobiales bacterium]
MGSNGSRPVDGDGRRPPEPGADTEGVGSDLRPWAAGAGRHGQRTAGRRRRRTRLALLVGGAVTVVAWLVGFSASLSRVAPTIDDEEYVQEANDVCAQVARRLAGTVPPPADRAPGERARLIEETVAALEAMVDRLVTLRPATSDAEAVDRWLSAWDQVLDSGRRTAAALRVGDARAAEAASDRGTEPARQVNAFAGVNGITACTTRFG